jgi:hypothetical protein
MPSGLFKRISWCLAVYSNVLAVTHLCFNAKLSSPMSASSSLAINQINTLMTQSDTNCVWYHLPHMQKKKKKTGKYTLACQHDSY